MIQGLSKLAQNTLASGMTQVTDTAGPGAGSFEGVTVPEAGKITEGREEEKPAVHGRAGARGRLQGSGADGTGRAFPSLLPASLPAGADCVPGL